MNFVTKVIHPRMHAKRSAPDDTFREERKEASLRGEKGEDKRAPHYLKYLIVHTIYTTNAAHTM